MAEATMTSETSPYPDAPEATPAAERSGWIGSDLAIGGSLVVLLIALFLPWFSAPGIAGTDGPSSHGYLWLVFVLTILALIVLVARDAIARLPGNLPSPDQILVGATGLALLLTILGVVQEPSPFATPSSSIGWSYGGFVAMVAALIAVIAALRETGALRPGGRMSMPSRRRRSRA
jgi:uncharacterized membrane protein